MNGCSSINAISTFVVQRHFPSWMCTYSFLPFLFVFLAFVWERVEYWRNPIPMRQNHLVTPGNSFTSILTSTRCIIQSNGSKGLRSVLDKYEDFKLVQQLRKNGRANYYRYQQKLWPTTEALEKAMTEQQYSPTERSPLYLLPQRKASSRKLILEGKGVTALLDDVQCALKNDGEPTGDEVPAEMQKNTLEEALSELMGSSLSINDKIITESDLKGTILDSAREMISGDLSTNSLSVPSTLLTSTAVAAGLHQRHGVIPSAKDPGNAAWEALGLDPLLSKRAEEKYGKAPSRLQCRLIPSLLNEDHNDVIFNGVTGSGKTTALLLALMQAIRSESAGMNIFIAADTMNAMQVSDQLRALCGYHGGFFSDSRHDDWSWLYMGTIREEYKKYYNTLCRSLKSKHGPIRLFITTADTMCQLLFEMKMEFEGFGFLRRVYVDDIGRQMPMLHPNAPVAEARERIRNPPAAALLLGTLHQLPGPHVRSLLQLGLVSADLDGLLKDHLKSLCVKPERHTIVLAPVRVPSTIHCLFSFHLFNENVYDYTVRLIWNARKTIPGRAVIFVRAEDNMIQVRTKLRSLGMDAKLFSEVYHDGEFCDTWKFLLLRESEAFGLDLPHVSHVFITFCPRTTASFQHMCGRTGRLGNVGWAYTIVDKRESKNIREIASQLDVDFCNHVIDSDLAQVSPTDVDRQTKEPELYGLDPQYAVRQHYIVQSENPDMAYRSREFFSKPAHRQFQMEDYTPIPTLHRRFINAKKLAVDVDRDPSVVLALQKQRLLDERLKPTRRLNALLNNRSRKHQSAPHESKRSGGA